MALVALLSGCEEPKPVSLIALLDSSASFEPRRNESLAIVRSVSERLEPQIDKVIAFRVAGEVYWLYDNERPGGKKLMEALGEYVKVATNDRGTAYGTALERGLKEARDVSGKVGRSAVVILGDGADERSSKGANIDWATLPQRFEKFPQNANLFFLFVAPQAGDRFRETLKPVLGERLHLFTPESTNDGTAKRKILDYLER